MKRFWILVSLALAGLAAGAATVSAHQGHTRPACAVRGKHATCRHRSHPRRGHHKHHKHHRRRKPSPAAPAGLPSPPSIPPSASPNVAAIQHVVWIWMENNDYSSIYGPQPYETTLANTYGLATNYYGIGHYSADNYIAATSGISWNSCLGGDGSPSSCPQSQDNIFHQLGLGNAVNYVESGNTDSNHNPVEYYTDLGSGFEQTLPSTFSSTTFSPKFAFITPNRTDDGHDSGPGTGDSWLSGEVPKIMATPQYQSGSMAIFVTFDESNVNDTQGATSPPSNHVYTAVISPYTHGVKDATPYTHYSLLRTTEELLGLPLLGNAASANSMVGKFGF